MTATIEKEYKDGKHLILEISYVSLRYGIEDLEVTKAMLWDKDDKQLQVSDHFTDEALREIALEYIDERYSHYDEL